jgi:cell division protein FtsB
MDLTLESALLAALSAVTGSLVYLARAFYSRLIRAEHTIEELRQEMERLERENGRHSAQVEMYERCPQKASCPFYRQTHPLPQ